MKKTVKILGIALLSIVALTAVGAITLAGFSPGKLKPLTTGGGLGIAGSLAEKTFIDIDGIRQGFFLRTEDPSNPVILFLHGGPGSPELPMILPFEGVERLEKYFTVCYWDQRGAGMSFDGSLTPADAALDRYIEDTRRMTDYLRERFGQDKIYLMGHSWGSYLGVKAAERYPELYAAYIGIGQVSRQLESERLAYDYMLARARETGDKRAVASLEKFDPAAPDFPTVKYLMGPRTNLMNKYHIGLTHADVSMWKVFAMLLSFPGYTFGEKIKYVRGMGFSSNNVFHYVTDDNFFVSSTRFALPVYIIHGAWDYQVSHALARRWFEVIEAPRKEFFTFPDSAHAPNIEEPERFVQTVRQIANEVNQSLYNYGNH
jgi:pimeloyl-ACP methyl ester carboxylesterase